MFKNETVFILGAGASWHYGYPTGETLVKKVTAKAKLAADYFRQALQHGHGLTAMQYYLKRRCLIPSGSLQSSINLARQESEKAILECTDLADRLTTVDPLVIDYFLGQNADLQDIGKMLIAWVLLECETFYLTHRIYANHIDRLSLSDNPTDRLNSRETSYLQTAFDDNNSKLLDLPTSLELNKTLKAVLFTNFVIIMSSIKMPEEYSSNGLTICSRTGPGFWGASQAATFARKASETFTML
jgi:hypothetical protein